jgi:ketopantoate reductase
MIVIGTGPIGGIIGGRLARAGHDIHRAQALSKA